jgi:N-acetylglucosamine-6-phosphate deacetylase
MAFVITNVHIVLPDREVSGKELLIEKGLIKNIIAQGSFKGQRVDGKGGYLMPGFIDLHVHGGAGYHFVDGENIEHILKYHLTGGTTGLLVTTLSGNREQWEKAGNTCLRSYPFLPQIFGIHMEGPVINPQKAGIHQGKELGISLLDSMKQFIADYKEVVRLVTLAPELLGMEKFIPWLCSHNIVVAAGHSKASQTKMAWSEGLGVSRATHLFNAMSLFHHRKPGIVGENLLNNNITVELIADGIHLHPSVVEIVLLLKTYEKVSLVTDAVAMAGLPDGSKGTIAGQIVTVREKGVYNQEGILAGSSLTMIEAVRNMVSFTNCPLWQAVFMASTLPARTLGIQHLVGSIENGKQANLILTDRQLNMQKVWLDGVCVI